MRYTGSLQSGHGDWNLCHRDDAVRRRFLGHNGEYLISSDLQPDDIAGGGANGVVLQVVMLRAHSGLRFIKRLIALIDEWAFPDTNTTRLTTVIDAAPRNGDFNSGSAGMSVCRRTDNPARVLASYKAHGA
jgi:hypothetical protein